MIQSMRFGIALLGVIAFLGAGIGAQVTTRTIVGAVRDANGVARDSDGWIAANLSEIVVAR